ncbi:hypothetical protein [Wolbachia endosymbiont of Pentidionis agamae]|uniref:hypothetical protein n=1 Tax=Wolbachia endosymbiont of Pentidionis agamae TaxID=3110435 RepID=UPI002FCF2CDD
MVNSNQNSSFESNFAFTVIKGNHYELLKDHQDSMEELYKWKENKSKAVMELGIRTNRSENSREEEREFFEQIDSSRERVSKFIEFSEKYKVMIHKHWCPKRDQRTEQAHPKEMSECSCGIECKDEIASNAVENVLSSPQISQALPENSMTYNVPYDYTYNEVGVLYNAAGVVYHPVAVLCNTQISQVYPEKNNGIGM